MKCLTMLVVAALVFSANARSYSFKLVGSGGTGGDNDYIWYQDKSKHIIAELSIGRPGPTDRLDPLEIRAASVFKDIKTKRAFINDVASVSFTSTNSVTTKVAVISGSAGKRVDRDAKVSGGYDFSHGYTVAGLIVEIWQGNKCLKHLSNLPGKDGKTSLKKGVPEMLLNADDKWSCDCRERDAKEMERYKTEYFKNATQIKKANGEDLE